MTKVVPYLISTSPDILTFLEAANKAGGRSAIGAVGAPASALAKRLAVFADVTGGLLAEASGLTAAEQGRARADIGADILGGFRNKIINPDFEIAQRGSGPFAGGIYGFDRWRAGVAGSSISTSRQLFTIGQTDVPGNPTYFARCTVASVAGAGNLAIYLQFIEGVRTLAGRQATLTFWAKADASKNMSAELTQVFGTGGSSEVQAIDPQKVALTTAWQKFSLVFNVPSITGKVVGTGDKLQINLWFDAGSNHNARTVSLGQQSGTFDIAHVSLVEGDARAEFDPTSPRHIQQETAMCQWYYEKTYNLTVAPGTVATAGCVVIPRSTITSENFTAIRYRSEKRTTPTVTIFSPSTGAAGKIRNNTGASDLDASVYDIGTSGCYVGAVFPAVGSSGSFHFIADAEL